MENVLFNHQQGVVEADDVNERNNEEQQLLPRQPSTHLSFRPGREEKTLINSLVFCSLFSNFASVRLDYGGISFGTTLHAF